MSNGEELANCPFCGGRGEVYGPDPRLRIYVRCRECGARATIALASHGGTVSEAIAAWNRRPSPSAVEAAEVVDDAWLKAFLLRQDWIYPNSAIKADPSTDDVIALLRAFAEALPPPASPSAPQGVEVTLAKCPVGLFIHKSGGLCLKTEYGNNEGRIDAYIVSSGEFFWGDAPQTIASQRAQLVTPVDGDALLSAIQTSPEAGR